MKTASLKDENAIKFSCRTTHVNCTGVKNERYSSEDIDYFATYWKDQCYLVSIKECSAEKTLRFDYPKNGQKKGVTLASDYELETQIRKMREEVAEH